MKHLSIRVAWHDNKWNGTVCNQPNQNSYCIQLKRIYANKKDNEPAGAKWDELKPEQLPPCKAEGGAFMNPETYSRGFTHPYSFSDTHKHLTYTLHEVPPYTTFAVPFWWMLRKNQDTISEEHPNLVQKFENPPFGSPWVFDHKRQQDLLRHFFSELKEERSLVLFYTKSGQPVDEDIRRLLIGIGEITKVGKILAYDKNSDGRDFPIWDRQITHSIRDYEAEEEASHGFLIPYHEYLELPDDFELKIDGEIKTKQDLLDDITVSLLDVGQDQSRIDEFSYGSELISNETTLATLSISRDVVEKIQRHGIVKGPWKQRLLWISDQIGKIKEQMGPFPSFGQALVAFGFRYGNLFSKDIYDLKLCGPKENPWDVFHDAVNGRINKLSDKEYYQDLLNKQKMWSGLPSDLEDLLELLSRFKLTAKQIKKWYNPDLRKKFTAISTGQILDNPYLLVEEDDPQVQEHPISVETIDAGLFEDRAIQGECIPEERNKIDSNEDERRVRAAVIELLKSVANDDGDTLLSITEICERINEWRLPHDLEIDTIFLKSHADYLKEKLIYIDTEAVTAFQLKIYSDIETYLTKVFTARAKAKLNGTGEDWKSLIRQTVSESGASINDQNERHIDALKDQSEALEKISTHKLSVLHGPAGTGKTSVLGAFVKSEKLRKDGILLLAPTGKARVKLGDMAGTEAYTIAQFLTRLKRFDWKRMKPKFHGKEKYRGEKTIVVDECSMLTEDDFYALFQAIDMAHVNRIILVGDPYQLPPIGAGRPFADLCAWLDVEQEDQSEIDPKRRVAANALARLKIVVRTAKGDESDALALANWFAGRKAGKNNDSIFERIADNEKLNDLRIEFWESDSEVEKVFKEVLINELNLNGEGDFESFNVALGANENGFFPMESPEVIEGMQILTPQRNPVWGSYSINRLIQENFRKRPNNWEKSIGDQQIWQGDKVIQLKNEKRKPYKADKEYQLSNGQIGYAISAKKGFLNVTFSGHPNFQFGFSGRDFDEDSGLIELAYSITIHKSQGSDFNKVFLIVPKNSPLLSRELLYTGLTRAKDKLILLVEGDDFSWIGKYSNAETSSTAKRNTMLFNSNIRESRSSIPYVENLIHKANDGTFVRSKSEVIICNLLNVEGIEYEYERRFETENGWRLPDFTFIDPAGETIILEHLGMLHKHAYREDWEKKKAFYESHGFIEGENLFITVDDEKGGIDSKRIKESVIEKIAQLI